MQVIHANVALTNLLLSGNFRVLELADFVFAREMQKDETSTTEHGTSGYMAPEVCAQVVLPLNTLSWLQVRFGKAYGTACDIYSWAVCCAYALSNEWPHFDEVSIGFEGAVKVEFLIGRQFS